jgi:SAM-dependent methyltransferase
VTDDAGTEQIAYYRARAVEYDADAYGPEAQALITQAIEQIPVGSDLLELACGTGVWTQRLVRRAATVTAVDAAPEMLELARARAPQAIFIRADLLAWNPPRRFHTISFAFWLVGWPGGITPPGSHRSRYVDLHITGCMCSSWLC